MIFTEKRVPNINLCDFNLQVDQVERDIKTATHFIKICMNLFTDITTLDVSEPLMATLEMIEKAVCAIQKNIDIHIENKEFEEAVSDTLEVLVIFKDHVMIKRRTIYNQEQWPKKSIVNLITDTITKNGVRISSFYFRLFLHKREDNKIYWVQIPNELANLIVVQCVVNETFSNIFKSKIQKYTNL